MSEQPSYGGQPVRRLTRSRSDRVLAGVCGGIAEYAGVDANVVRVVTVLVVVLGALTPAIAYLVAWALLPEGS